MKKITSILIFTFLLLGCSNDDEVHNSSNPKSKLFGIESVFDNNTSYKIIELDVNSGKIISTIQERPYMQARLDFDMAYLKTTNHLLLRQDVYENARGSELLKINLESQSIETMQCDDFYKMLTTASGRLFGLIKTSNETVNLVEINPNSGKVISILESFNPLEEAPDNDKTGVSNIFYSEDSKEIFIPRRLKFVSGAFDDLIKINIETNDKSILKIQNYETILSGKNSRLFAIKYEDKSYKLIEIDKNNGNEKNVLQTFNFGYYNRKITYLSETNEIVVSLVNGIAKINIDTKERKDIEISNLSSVSAF